VVITSVFRNNPESLIHFHVISPDLTTSERGDICSYISINEGLISFYKVSQKDIQGMVIPEKSYFTIATYYRLFFPSLIPARYEKVLYLDTDLVINGELSSLYNTDLLGMPVGVVVEESGVKSRPDLGIYDEYVYFNSGVMLMNIAEWNRQGITEKAIRFIHEHPEKIRWVDQDALNVVLQKNYYRLDAKYNVINTDIPRELPKKQYRSFLKNKVVIHYTLSENKPWYYFSGHKLRFLYQEYKKLAPANSGKKYLALAPANLSVKKIIRSRIMEQVYNYPVLLKPVRKLKKIMQQVIQ
jgi:lipopolysaccharide biosynthesis glycosyltransferase